MLQHAQGLSGALYAAAGADPTVTARTLAGVSRTSLGGSSAQGDQTNVLDAVVATQLFATLAGIANQVDDDSGLFAAAAIVASDFARMRERGQHRPAPGKDCCTVPAALHRLRLGL